VIPILLEVDKVLLFGQIPREKNGYLEVA